MALSLDGSVGSAPTGGSSQSVTLSTTNPNDIICVVVFNESGSAVNLRTVSSVTATGLTFAKRASGNALNGNIQCDLELWWAFASAALSSVSITVNLSGVTDDWGIVAFGVSGALSSTSPFDSNGGNPVLQTNGTGALTFSTTQAHDFLIYASGSRNNNGANQLSSPWTVIQRVGTAGGTNFSSLEVDYQIVSSAQSGDSVSQAGGTSPAVAFADAITADAIATPRLQTAVTVICG